MNIDADTVKLIFQGGPAVVFAIIIILFVQDPDRAEKVKAFFLRPFFLLFGWGTRQYLAAEVNSKTTDFFKRHITRLIPSLQSVKISIKWVSSATDPVLTHEGTLILRLQDTGDQTRNTLMAAQIALPSVVCATVRNNLSHKMISAIDLTLLRNFAERLGKHARPVFQRHFLDPEIAKNDQIAPLFKELVELDTAGIFVAIFLEEANLLGDVLYSDADQSDHTGEVVDFLQFLLRLARRGIGEEIPLEFHSSGLHVGILLLAKSYKAANQGIVPYIQRIDRYITLRCESIYIAAYHPAQDFMYRIIKSIQGDNRLSVAKEVRVKSKTVWSSDLTGICHIVLLRPNTVSSEADFTDQIRELGIKEGIEIDGTVIDVSYDFAVVDIGGVNAIIRKEECSWFINNDCTESFQEGRIYKFSIKSINLEKHRILLTRRFERDNPWQTVSLPKKGEIIEVSVVGIHCSSLVARFKDFVEVLIPSDELSWTEYHHNNLLSWVGSNLKVVIYEKDVAEHILLGSIRRMQKDPWPQICERFPPKSEFTAPVMDINHYYVTVKLPGGIPGRIASEEFERAGFEYANYEENIVIGQRLQVVVTKVFIRQQRIRLALKRNV